jgi:dTDP-4-dehydrorhamnose reductase
MNHDLSRILLTGGNGQVGRALRLTLPQSATLIAPDRGTLDLTNADSIRSTVRDCRPTLIINAAAYTAVDRAETEADLAMAVNGVAPGVFAEETKRLNATLVHYSTDYVFDGSKSTAYTETDTPNPLSVYGQTSAVHPAHQLGLCRRGREFPEYDIAPGARTSGTAYRR